MQQLGTLTEKNLRVAGYQDVIRQAKDFGVNCDETYRGWAVEAVISIVEDCLYAIILIGLIVRFML